MTESTMPLPPLPADVRRFRRMMAALIAYALLIATLAVVVAIGGSVEWLPWLMLAIVALLGALALALLVRSNNDRTGLRILSQTMTRTARTDWLTGGYNRRALAEQLTRTTAHARRHGESVAVMIADLDRFTEINERFGARAGDELLCAFSECVQDVLRADDVFGRWGGDEFLVILPAIDAVAVEIAASRLSTAVARLATASGPQSEPIELSIGTASGVHTSPDTLIRAAELDLSQAKAAKRAARMSTARA